MSDLKYELKKLIIEECEKDCQIEDIKDDEPLFGPDTILELDSMDALQISMAIHKKYGLKTNDKIIIITVKTFKLYFQFIFNPPSIDS